MCSARTVEFRKFRKAELSPYLVGGVNCSVHGRSSNAVEVGFTMTQARRKRQWKLFGDIEETRRNAGTKLLDDA